MATERDHGEVHYDGPEQLAFGTTDAGATWWSCLRCSAGGDGPDEVVAADRAMTHVLSDHPDA